MAEKTIKTEPFTFEGQEGYICTYPEGGSTWVPKDQLQAHLNHNSAKEEKRDPWEHRATHMR